MVLLLVAVLMLLVAMMLLMVVVSVRDARVVRECGRRRDRGQMDGDRQEHTACWPEHGPDAGCFSHGRRLPAREFALCLQRHIGLHFRHLGRLRP